MRLAYFFIGLLLLLFSGNTAVHASKPYSERRFRAAQHHKVKPIVDNPIEHSSTVKVGCAAEKREFLMSDSAEDEDDEAAPVFEGKTRTVARLSVPVYLPVYNSGLSRSFYSPHYLSAVYVPLQTRHKYIVQGVLRI